MTSWVLLRKKGAVRQISSAALFSPNSFSSYKKKKSRIKVLKTKIIAVKMNIKYFIMIN